MNKKEIAPTLPPEATIPATLPTALSYTYDIKANVEPVVRVKKRENIVNVAIDNPTCEVQAKPKMSNPPTIRKPNWASFLPLKFNFVAVSRPDTHPPTKQARASHPTALLTADAEAFDNSLTSLKYNGAAFNKIF
jgi:hypothetical protein